MSIKQRLSQLENARPVDDNLAERAKYIWSLWGDILTDKQAEEIAQYYRDRGETMQWSEMMRVDPDDYDDPFA